MMEKRGMMSDYLLWLLIALAVIAVGIGFVLFSTAQGRSALDFIKNLFRFGG